MRPSLHVARALPALLPLLAFAAACAGSDAPPPGPSAPPPPASEALSSSAPTAPPSAPPTAAPTAAPSASASAPPAPASPCPDGMALLPAGKYTMGPPKRDVSVNAFCMDKSETTADDYAACVKAGKCTQDNLNCSAQATFGAKDKGNHPIVCVDFEQATAYCKAQNKRLPSDAEWEWAARGGAEGREFPWGNDKPGADKACWSGKDARTATCPIGATPGGDSPQGIHDLAGNVFEWVTSPTDGKGNDRVGRGGSWRDGTPSALKASRPAAFKVTYRCGFLGIRCVSEPSPAAK